MATTDEVWRLDNLQDDDCLFFQSMANSGHAGRHEPGKSRQGIYVCSADGQCLASINQLSAKAVLETMNRGMKKWKQLPKNERSSASAKKMNPKRRWENSRPTNGLVLSVHSRDLLRSATSESRSLKYWNVDSAWFIAKEVRSFIPNDIAEGDEFEFGDVFVDRLCKLHFVDSVKGQTDSFDQHEIAGSSIMGKVESIEDKKVKIVIHGNTSGVRETGKFKRGVATKLIGEAIFDQSEQQFTKFDMVAIGQRWGRTRFNDRVSQPKKSPIGFAFHLTKPDEPVVVPGIVWAYKVPWLKLLP